MRAGQGDRHRFESLVLPYLGSAFNLARWVLGDTTDAEDIVQEAMLRAYRFFPTCRAAEPKAWLLQIVRNCCYTWLKKNRSSDIMTEFDEEMYEYEMPTPETLATQADQRRYLMLILEALPARYREVLVLRELDGCSYKEIATIMGIPKGTVMSTLSRARERLQRTATGALT